MKILWICGGLLPQACKALGCVDTRLNGGFMGSLLQSLVEADHSNRFCVLCWDTRRCDLVVDGVRYVSFGGSDKTTLKGVSSKDGRKAKRVIDAFNPDVIHILGTEGVFAHMPEWVFENRKVVVSLQGIISQCAVNFSGQLMSEDLRGTWLNYGFLRYGMTMSREQRFWSNVRGTLEARTMRRRKYFIGRTGFDRAWAMYFNPAAQYYHVDECVRPAFYRARRCRQDVRRHVVYCGGAVGYPLKGGHVVIKAVAALKRVYPDIQLRIANAQFLASRITLAQRLRCGYYALYLRRLIQELGVERHIVALPALSETDVVEELRHAELFVLPSFCENSPNALVEAMLVGTPSIASDVGGVASMIKDGENGCLVPAGDPAQLSMAIAYCFEHREEVEGWAQKAQNIAMVRNAPENVANSQLNAYAEIINRGLA